MKSAIICYYCDKLTRFIDSYAMKVTRYWINKQANIPSEKPLFDKVRVCKSCAKKAGYKVKQSKPKVKKIGPKEGRDNKTILGKN